MLCNNNVPEPPPAITGLTNSQIKQDANRSNRRSQPGARAITGTASLAYGGTHRMYAAARRRRRNENSWIKGSRAMCLGAPLTRGLPRIPTVWPTCFVSTRFARAHPRLHVTAPVGTDVRFAFGLFGFLTRRLARVQPSLFVSLSRRWYSLFITAQAPPRVERASEKGTEGQRGGKIDRWIRKKWSGRTNKSCAVDLSIADSLVDLDSIFLYQRYRNISFLTIFLIIYFCDWALN